MNEEEKKAIEKLMNGEKVTIQELMRKMKKEGVERFVITRPEYIYTILSLIEKLQKENELAKQALIKNCNIADERNQLLKENEELKTELERQKNINRIINQKGLEKNYEKALEKTMTKFLKNNIDKDFIPVQKVKDIIEKINYDIKKTKEIIHTSNRKNDYQIVRLKAMNTKSLDIKNRLQELIEENVEED